MSMGLLAPDRVVSLRTVAQLQDCYVDGGTLVVGAGLTHRDVARDALVGNHAPLLAEVTSEVGNIRVRSTGTVGGNLAFAEPRSDVITTLLALDARVRLAAVGGHRELSLSTFLRGPYEVDLRHGELITSIVIPIDKIDYGVYRKIVRSERPIVGVALTYFAQGRWRLVVGAVGMSATIVEAATPAGFEPTAIADQVDTAADLSGSETYKRHLTQVVIARCCRAAASFVANHAEGGLDNE
jgi:carbon-monoxide dehydrogenase medium subunit